ncbi:2-oxoglutarate ferredoxin oxidoreductase subunit alpha, partial [Streptomyces eurythermus]
MPRTGRLPHGGDRRDDQRCAALAAPGRRPDRAHHRGRGGVVTAKDVRRLDRVIIRFAGDSGDGMQLTGDRFTS